MSRIHTEERMNEQSGDSLPEFAHPPVNEVVCGVHFRSLEQFLTPYLGLLWESYQGEYSTCQEIAPLIPIIESFGDSLSWKKPEFAEIPPLPRVWFVHKNGNGIIQVQRDRFLHNWRKLDAETKYPRYGQVIEMFLGHFETLQKFLDQHKLGSIEPLQYEMTYVNHIYRGEGWTNNGDVGKLFADFAWRADRPRFLPEPEGINWRTTFVLPERAGRMHVSIQNGESREDNRPLYVFELTVRGIGADKELSGIRDWFDLAHEWIVRGFADLTGTQTQTEIWRRTG